MLLPYDLKEWLPANHIVHFTIAAAEMVPVEQFVVNERGSGDEQYHPHMLLALLLYCYSHGIFSSRRIEEATWSDVAVRYICANRHPDHDTICTFRIRNKVAISEAFLRILVLAKEMKILKLGTVSVDGSRIKANASIHKSIRYDRARELEQELKLEIDELLARAESEDKVKDERGDEVGAVQEQEIEVLVSVTKETDHSPRRHDFRPKKDPLPPAPEKPNQLQWVKLMADVMGTDEAKKLYRLRKQSIEPVFGIVKQILGFRQFLLRGLEKVELEWELVLCAYNLKRLAVLCS
jgi:transposase